MFFRLFIHADGTWRHCLDLAAGREYTLGRSRSNDIVVDDEHCSRVHLRFYDVENAWVVEEQDASNPTFVENERLGTSRTLEVGNVISIGMQTLLLFSDQETVQQGTVQRDSGQRDSGQRDSGQRGDVTSWLGHIKHDGGEARSRAQQDLVERYFQRLCDLAKRRSEGLDGRVEDAEDAVVSAWASFFLAVEKGRLSRLENRTDLWKVLATFTVRKVIRQRERQSAKRRDSKRTVTDAALSNTNSETGNGIERLADESVNHELEVAFQESIEMFLGQLDEELREIVEMNFAGLSNHEIAERQNCSERTIKRRIAEIRKAWGRFESSKE